MKIFACLLLFLCTIPAVATPGSSARVRTFFLEGVRSGKWHGPVMFTSGTRINLDTGTFRLDVLSAAGSFILTDEQSGAVFGVYDLVQGRIIDAGYQLFTITRLSTTQAPPGSVPARPPAGPEARQPAHRPAAAGAIHFGQNYKIGIVADLINQIAYDWTIDEQLGGSAKYIDRRGATLFLTRGILTISAGLLVDSEWQETIDDQAGRFEQGKLISGNGWKSAIQLLIPVFTDGRWSASVGGGVHHQRESFDLEYANWQSRIISPTTITNSPMDGVTNGIPEETTEPIIGEQLIRRTDNATLSETWVDLTARIDYTAPNWFAYAGLRALPWVDTDVRATIEIDDLRFPLAFKRKDPLSGYAAAGFSYQDVHTYLEIEGGGINAIRIGVMLDF